MSPGVLFFLIAISLYLKKLCSLSPLGSQRYSILLLTKIFSPCFALLIQEARQHTANPKRIDYSISCSAFSSRILMSLSLSPFLSSSRQSQVQSTDGGIVLGDGEIKSQPNVNNVQKTLNSRSKVLDCTTFDIEH